MDPFDVLPLNLFNLFSTQGVTSLQRHYMAILLRIYGLAEFNRFGLARDVVVAKIVDYLKGAEAEGEIAAEMANQESSPQGARAESAASNGPTDASVSITGQKSEGIMHPISSAAWKKPVGSSASSTPITAKPSPCPIMRSPCWRLFARSKNKSRTNSRGKFTRRINSSPPPKPTRISRLPWP